MKIAILGGSFNPIHVGHLWTAQQVLEDKMLKINEVWFMPNYSSKSYSEKKLIGWHDRHEMCRQAKDDFDVFNYKMKICDIEGCQQFEYTYQTIDYLTEHYPKDEFYWIIGSDWRIQKFKNYEQILKNCKIIQVQRSGYEHVLSCHHCIKDERYEMFFVKTSSMFLLSSTEIRNRIKKHLKITGLVTPSVEKYIDEKRLYV